MHLQTFPLLFVPPTSSIGRCEKVMEGGAEKKSGRVGEERLGGGVSQIEKVFIGRMFNQRLQILSAWGSLAPQSLLPVPPTSSVSHYEGWVISTQTGH